MMSMYRTAFYLAVLSAAALGGGCMTGDGDGAGTVAAEPELAGADQPVLSDPQAPAERLVAPPAPEGAAPAVAGGDQGKISNLAASPSISPGTSIETVAPGQVYTCALGTLCTGVWDPNVSKWRVFKLVVCTTYSVSNWNGSGFYWDNQTGSPLSTYYGQSRNPLISFRPGGGQLAVDWSPVWFIKNC